MKRFQKKQLFRKIALKRIKELFKQAALKFKKFPDYSNRYVTLARKIQMKYKVKMPKDLKRQFCKKCNTYLVPGSNCRVRVQNKKIIYNCNSCKNFTRIPLK